MTSQPTMTLPEIREKAQQLASQSSTYEYGASFAVPSVAAYVPLSESYPGPTEVSYFEIQVRLGREYRGRRGPAVEALVLQIVNALARLRGEL